MREADTFIPLAELLRPRSAPPAEPLSSEAVPPEPEAVVAPAPGADDALRAARLFAAALADALDAALAQLVRDLAADVLARELLLAPADVAAIARRLLAERCADGPVRLRVAPQDAGVACALPVIVDGGLHAGDAMLECASGSIDARLGVRLADVLAAGSR